VKQEKKNSEKGCLQVASQPSPNHSIASPGASVFYISSNDWTQKEGSLTKSPNQMCFQWTLSSAGPSTHACHAAKVHMHVSLSLSGALSSAATATIPSYIHRYSYGLDL